MSGGVPERPPSPVIRLDEATAPRESETMAAASARRMLIDCPAGGSTRRRLRDTRRVRIRDRRARRRCLARLRRRCERLQLDLIDQLSIASGRAAADRRSAGAAAWPSPQGFELGWVSSPRFMRFARSRMRSLSGPSDAPASRCRLRSRRAELGVFGLHCGSRRAAADPTVAIVAGRSPPCLRGPADPAALLALLTLLALPPLLDSLTLLILLALSLLLTLLCLVDLLPFSPRSPL